MNFPDYNSPSALKAFLESRGMAMQKKFGQNFLINASVREKLLDILALSPGDDVWEVGPGLGAMTSGILERGGVVTAFEIDRGFSSVLRELFGQNPRFTLIEGDVLKTWRKAATFLHTKPQEATTAGRPLFFGNLPYNIAAALLGDLITGGMIFPRAAVTVQREVAERICAAPGSGNYSSFSVICSRFYDCSIELSLPAGNFWPRPNVASSAVLMKEKKQKAVCKDDALFFAVVRALFSSRRKTAKNTLAAWLAARFKGNDSDAQSADLARLALKRAGIAESERPENLGFEAFCALADAVAEQGVSHQRRSYLCWNSPL